MFSPKASESDKPVTLIRTGFRAKLPRGLSHPVGAELISKALAGVPRYDDLWIAFGQGPLVVGSPAPKELHGFLRAFRVNCNNRSGWHFSVWAVPGQSRAVVRRLLVDIGLPTTRAWLLRHRPQTWYDGFRSFEVGCRVDPPHVCTMEMFENRLVSSSILAVGA